MIRLRYAIVSVLFLLCSFTASVQAADAQVTHYFPLALGNRWVYELQDRKDAAPLAEERWEVVREEQGIFVLRIRQSDPTTGGFEESFIPTTEGIKAFLVIEGSGTFYPQRQDKVLLRLREWKRSTTMSR